MAKILRPQRHTLLIVHEGYAEECLLAHLKALYVPRNSGIAVSMQNARGGGGQHVLNHALRVRRRTAYDEIAILTDTDQDWDDAQRQRAIAGHIHAVESSPCLEAWLLDANGHQARGNGAQIKRQFEVVYGGVAHDPRVYPRNFPRELLDNARSRV